MNDVYLIIKKDETGMTFQSRVPKPELASHIKDVFELGGITIVAIILL